MIGDFVLAFLVLAGCLLGFYWKSARKDREDEEAKQDAARRDQAAAREEARKYRNGTPLVCLACSSQFIGPLTELGCPRCHLSSFVVTDTNRKNKE